MILTQRLGLRPRPLRRIVSEATEQYIDRADPRRRAAAGQLSALGDQPAWMRYSMRAVGGWHVGH